MFIGRPKKTPFGLLNARSVTETDPNSEIPTGDGAGGAGRGWAALRRKSNVVNGLDRSSGGGGVAGPHADISVQG